MLLCRQIVYEMPRGFIRLKSISETIFWILLINETTKLLSFEVLKNMKTVLFRVTQSLRHHVGF